MLRANCLYGSGLIMLLVPYIFNNKDNLLFCILQSIEQGYLQYFIIVMLQDCHRSGLIFFCTRLATGHELVKRKSFKATKKYANVI